ncbi:MAG: hypothetical protein PSW75_12045, partial [bacterium]|nr:hypothetical protein [bacterium]
MNSRSTLVLVCAVVFAGFTGCRHAPADDPLAARKIDGPPAATPGRQLNQVVILDREVTDGSGASSPP